MNNNNIIHNMTSKYLAERRIKKNKSSEEIKNNHNTDIKIEKENEMSQNIEKRIDDLIKVLKGRKLLYNIKINDNSNKNQN